MILPGIGAPAGAFADAVAATGDFSNGFSNAFSGPASSGDHSNGTDTVRTRSSLVSLLADNSAGDVSSQDQRDFTASGIIVSQGSGAPGSAPASLFETYYDTTNHIAYIATGTSAATDWKKVGNDWRQVASWTYASNVSVVDFTGLAPFTDLMAVLRLVTLASTGIRAMRVSTDNGSTFYSGASDYQIYATTGAATSADHISLHLNNATSARTGIAYITNSSANGVTKEIQNPTNTTLMNYFVGSTSPINALRFYSTGGDYSGGSIQIFGR